MIREREELIDYLLGELPAERSREVAGRIARDPEAAADRDLLRETIALVRSAASEGWEAPAGKRGRLQLLRPALAAAAVIIAIVTGMLMTNGVHPPTVFDPDGAYGYARAEEADAQGGVFEPSRTNEILLRTGQVKVNAVGSERKYPLRTGETVPFDSDLETPADAGARVDLPGGGILFLRGFTTVRLRRHQAGGTAVRLIDGTACSIVGGQPLHLAVEGTDLLLLQSSGAALLRKRPAEAVALRGELELLLEGGKRFTVPESERLPAACAREPVTAPVTDDELQLDWYRGLVYTKWQIEDVTWAEPGRSTPLRTGEDTLLYLRVVPAEAGTLEVSFGGEPREFHVHRDVPLRLRLRLEDLGQGPTLVVTPAAGIKEARLFQAQPRR